MKADPAGKAREKDEKMKIMISKRITLSDVNQAQQIRVDYMQGDASGSLDGEELQRAAALYLGEGDISAVKIYESTVAVAYHNGGVGLLSEDENLQTQYPLDIYIELFARGSQACGEIGFYLSDFWQSDGSNEEELRHRAYRDVFTKVK